MRALHTLPDARRTGSDVGRTRSCARMMSWSRRASRSTCAVTCGIFGRIGRKGEDLILKCVRGQLVFVPCLCNKFWNGCCPHKREQSHALASLSILHTSTLWPHKRMFPNPPATSSSESSLLEEQMRGRHPFSNASATPPRVR